MKKILRILLITLLSLTGVILIGAGILLFVVFTPEKLTPIVRKEAAKALTCKAEIGSVELTFFSTFPDFGIRVENIRLVNPAPDSRYDTLLSAGELVASIDAAALWKKDEIILKGMTVKNGALRIYADTLGFAGYDIVAPDSLDPAGNSDPGTPTFIDIRNVTLEDVDLLYRDLELGIDCGIKNLFAAVSGKITDDQAEVNLKVDRSLISFVYDGEKYLDNDAVVLSMPAGYIPAREEVFFRKAGISINGVTFTLDGSVSSDSSTGAVNTDLSYELISQPADELVKLIPPSLATYLEGIQTTGLLSSTGTIKGAITATGFPMLDLVLKMEKGTLTYSGFDLPLHDIDGDLAIRTDLTTDSLSVLDIRKFSAHTPRSSFTLEGTVDHLFSDIRCDLTSTANLDLAEFSSMIPDSLKMSVSGSASGTVRSAFTMSQLSKMLLDRMKFSGSVSLNGLDLKYDSINLAADRSVVEFSLPNNKAGGSDRKFARMKLAGGTVSAGKEGSYRALLLNPDITLETSDIRDTTRVTSLSCFFALDSLAASYDSLSINLSKPGGRASTEPRTGHPKDPRIHLVYSGGQLETGTSTGFFTAGSIELDADILNDSGQKDFLRQWIISGFIKMEKGKSVSAGLAYPVEIPSLAMNFDPETFRISEASVKIGSSDFRLTGQLSNILSYYRRDSLLRGNFTFSSASTNLNQLMALTSGMGEEGSSAQDAAADTSYTGPYMVPKGIDFVLSAEIRAAVFGADTAKNITGKIVLKDGILVLDDLSLRAPAAKIQLTSIYRTPRKNHIFLGLDYHMFDIEIEELLRMIPDIDSLMPMLRSFRGKGEFHFAVDVYTDSLYNIKKSTLRGSAAIKGNDLVLLDGETFTEIAKKLRFNKKTENRVDSLAAEFTIFRDEIDVYPFLLVMDKYKAVIAGKHNFDLSYDYHISVVDCPLPIRLGIDIKGTGENMDFDLAPCRYDVYFRPSSRHVVEAKRLELRKLIRDSLTSKLKEQ